MSEKKMTVQEGEAHCSWDWAPCRALSVTLLREQGDILPGILHDHNQLESELKLLLSAAAPPLAMEYRSLDST